MDQSAGLRSQRSQVQVLLLATEAHNPRFMPFQRPLAYPDVWVSDHSTRRPAAVKLEDLHMVKRLKIIKDRGERDLTQWVNARRS